MQDFDFIETPENVELERRLAGIGSRFAAGLLDTLLYGACLAALLAALILMSIAGLLGPLAGIPGVGWWGLAFVILLAFAVYWGYFVFFEMRTNGQSPGKRRLRIRVVKDGGGPITFTDIAIRNLLRAVDMLAAYGVAGLCMFLTRKVQRLGDLAAGTVVVSEQLPDYSAQSDRRAAAPWERQASPEALRATGLRPQEYRVLFNYWTRRQELTLEARRRLLPQLLRPILERDPAAPAGRSVEALEEYVDALLRSAEEAEQGPSRAGEGEGAR